MVSIADPRGYESTLRKEEWDNLDDTESDGEEEPLPELPVLDDSKSSLLLISNIPAEKAKKYDKLDKVRPHLLPTLFHPHPTPHTSHLTPHTSHLTPPHPTPTPHTPHPHHPNTTPE